MFGRARQYWIRYLAIGAVILTPAVWMAERDDFAAHAALNPDSPLLVTTRASLQLCGDASPALANRKREILARLSSQAQALRTSHPRWNDAYGRESDAPRFGDDCALPIPSAPIDEADGMAFGRGLVTEPAPFRAVVLVIDDATADKLLGDRHVSHFPYEMMKIDDHNAAEVTNGIAVRESYLRTRDFVDQCLSVAVSLPPRRTADAPAVRRSTGKPRATMHLNSQVGRPQGVPSASGASEPRVLVFAEGVAERSATSWRARRPSPRTGSRGYYSDTGDGD